MKSTESSLLRSDGRSAGDLRPPKIEVGFQRVAEGAVLYRAGGTLVLCTASVEAKVPPFLEGKGSGWVTAEYQMHPRANPRRESREGRGSKGVSGRTQEIQRLIGRSLRSAIDLQRLGERQIAIDCDVLEADGGTRTASVTGGYIALSLALDRLFTRGDLAGPVIRSPVAAISVGYVDGTPMLDLVYTEDARARVDLNLVATESLDIVEVQATAEGEALPRSDLDSMVDVGLRGITLLCALQRDVLRSAGCDPTRLVIGRTGVGTLP